MYLEIQTYHYIHIADNIPAEILARGPEAVEAYVRLRKQGNAPLFRSRVFLLGQNRASNIRFRSSLLSNNNNKNKSENSNISKGINSVIECHHWCRITNKGQWKTQNGSFEKITPDDATSDNLKITNKISGSKSKSGLNLEDDYNKAIARNIAIEIIKAKQQREQKKSNINNNRVIQVVELFLSI